MEVYIISKINREIMIKKAIIRECTSNIKQGGILENRACIKVDWKVQVGKEKILIKAWMVPIFYCSNQ